MITELTFYTTGGCHLCEDAMLLLQQLLAEYPRQYQIEIIDISQSDELIEKYGIQIPVLLRSDLAKDLGWPFDYQMLRDYVVS